MSTSFGLSHIWTQGDAVTRLILIALVGMSVISWIVIVLKALDVWKHKQSALGSEQFWHTTSLAEGLAVLSHRPDNMFHTLSNVTMGKLAGSDGMLGGRSVIDPDGFPFSAKQTAAMERVTPRSQGGPTENDPTPNAQERSNPESLTEDQKKQVAEQQDKANFDKLEKEVKDSLAKNPRLESMSEQVKFVREKEGLRIEIIDKADFAMFPSGGMSMQGKASSLISEIAASLADMPNKIAIRGHTDSVPFNNKEGRNNWSLSAERAEVTRALLERSGIKENRFARIEGVADTDPFNPKDPRDPRNRRMSITVLYNEQD